MNTNDLSSPVTAYTLNENMYKKFGVRINFDKYTREDLENYRNILRTKIHQTETASNFNSLLSNETYQKDKYMVGLLNQKIKEMLGESIQELKTAIAERKLTSAEKAKREKEVKKLKGQKFKGGEEEMYAVATNIAKGKKMNKKKTNEGRASGAEMAHQHAMEYAKHHAKGNLEMCMHHKDACEHHGGKISHSAGGKCFHQHGNINNGQAYECSGMWDEGAVGAGIGAGIGAAVGGPMGAVAGGAMGGSMESRSVKGTAVREAKKAKPDFLDLDKDGNKKEPMKKAAKDKKMKEAMDPVGQEDDDINNDGKKDKTDSYLKNRRAAIGKAIGKKKTKESLGESIARFLAEDEESKAKDITAGVDMVNDFTSWMQRVGQYQTKSMIELSDSIRANFGQQEAERFKESVSQALASTLESLTHSREAISQAVAVLAGTAPAQEPMGMEPDMEVPGSGDTDMDMGGDEFGAADAAAGGPETTGRQTRESYVRESIQRGNRLMAILGSR